MLKDSPAFSTDTLYGSKRKIQISSQLPVRQKENKTTITICLYNTLVSSDDGFAQPTHTDSKRPASVLPPLEDSLTSPCLAA